uniref:Uncharacterized protein n=1 Tax=Romanomermis culicivorax TaxID=13658 RepID=A0A915JJ25_ROMCU
MRMKQKIKYKFVISWTDRIQWKHIQIRSSGRDLNYNLPSFSMVVYKPCCAANSFIYLLNYPANKDHKCYSCCEYTYQLVVYLSEHLKKIETYKIDSNEKAQNQTDGTIRCTKLEHKILIGMGQIPDSDLHAFGLFSGFGFAFGFDFTDFAGLNSNSDSAVLPKF